MLHLYPQVFFSHDVTWCHDWQHDVMTSITWFYFLSLVIDKLERWFLLYSMFLWLRNSKEQNPTLHILDTWPCTAKSRDRNRPISKQLNQPSDRLAINPNTDHPSIYPTDRPPTNQPVTVLTSEYRLNFQCRGLTYLQFTGFHRLIHLWIWYKFASISLSLLLNSVY